MIRMFAWVNMNITFFAYSSTVQLLSENIYRDVKVKNKKVYLNF
jgi:hypothetical protein